MARTASYLHLRPDCSTTTESFLLPVEKRKNPFISSSLFSAVSKNSFRRYIFIELIRPRTISVGDGRCFDHRHLRTRRTSSAPAPIPREEEEKNLESRHRLQVPEGFCEEKTSRSEGTFCRQSRASFRFFERRSGRNRIGRVTLPFSARERSAEGAFMSSKNIKLSLKCRQCVHWNRKRWWNDFLRSVLVDL